MHFTIREWAKTILWVLAVLIVGLAFFLGLREVRRQREMPQVIEVDGWSQKIKLPNGQILSIEDPKPAPRPAEPEGK